MSREERAHTRLAMTMAEDRHVDFGTFLRQAREQRGVSLQDLAVTTKISARVLEALERNDPSKLPGGIFSRSFVRAYAREVGVDPDVAVANFVSAFPDESGADEMPATTSAVEAESFEQRRRVFRVVVRLLGVVVLVAILAFIYYSKFRPRFLTTGPDGPRPSAAATVAQAPALPQRPPPATASAPSVMPGAALAGRRAGRRHATNRAGRNSRAPWRAGRALIRAGRHAGSAARGGRVPAGAARGGVDADRPVLAVCHRGRGAHAVPDGRRRRTPRVCRPAIDHDDRRQCRRTLGDAERQAGPRAGCGRAGGDDDDSRLRLRDLSPLAPHGVPLPHAAPRLFQEGRSGGGHPDDGGPGSAGASGSRTIRPPGAVVGRRRPGRPHRRRDHDRQDSGARPGPIPGTAGRRARDPRLLRAARDRARAVGGPGLGRPAARPRCGPRSGGRGRAAMGKPPERASRPSGWRRFSACP